MKRYLPLFMLVLVALLGAIALWHQMGGTVFAFMQFFMGLFFCQFALLKLFSPSGFADGFQMYDLIAKKFRFYAYLYPWIELYLGLSYLGFFYPALTYSLTVIFMGIGMIGVISALKKGLDVRCACMGTVLNVPLSTVTLSEDLLMLVMAAFMLFNELIRG